MSVTTTQAPATQAPPPDGLSGFRTRREALQQVGHAVAREAGGSVEEFFRAHEGSLRAVLPRQMNTGRLLKVALAAVRANPKLRECTVASLFGAVLACAQLGLEPNTPDGHLFLIPREKRTVRRDASGKVVKEGNNLVFDSTMEVQVQLGYRGRIELAYRNPRIRLFVCADVYSNDVYRVSRGTENKIVHEPELRGARGEFIGVYAAAKLDTGEWIFEPIPTEELERVRATYSDSFQQASADMLQARDDAQQAEKKWQRDKAARTVAKAEATPWIRDFVAMGRKTVVNRIWNFLPRTYEMTLAGALDARADAGQAQDLGRVVDGEAFAEVLAEQDKEDQPGTEQDGATTEAGQGSGAAPSEEKGAAAPGGDTPAPQLTDETATRLPGVTIAPSGEQAETMTVKDTAPPAADDRPPVELPTEAAEPTRSKRRGNLFGDVE